MAAAAAAIFKSKSPLKKITDQIKQLNQLEFKLIASENEGKLKVNIILSSL